MTRSELVSTLEALKAQGKPFIRLALVVALLNAIAAIYWAFFYAPRTSSRDVIVSGLVLFGVFIVTCGGAVLLISIFVRRHAPVCPHCGARITCADAKVVLTSGSCPKCMQRLFS